MVNINEKKGDDYTHTPPLYSNSHYAVILNKKSNFTLRVDTFVVTKKIRQFSRFLLLNPSDHDNIYLLPEFRRDKPIKSGRNTTMDFLFFITIKRGLPKSLD